MLFFPAEYDIIVTRNLKLVFPVAKGTGTGTLINYKIPGEKKNRIFTEKNIFYVKKVCVNKTINYPSETNAHCFPWNFTKHFNIELSYQ